jgi:hypothetical protein
VKLATLTVFGAGYVLGTRAGRARYEQIVLLARRAAEGLDGTGARDRLEDFSARLEAYARDNGHGASRAQSRP